MHPAIKAALHRLGTVLLAGVAGGAMQPGQPARGAVEPRQEAVGPAEQETWAAAQRVGTPAAYQRYLELFPLGAYAEEAFRRLVERSLKGQPVQRLVDIEPGAGPGDPPRQRVVAAAELTLY
jgi:hypothetical protein